MIALRVAASGASSLQLHTVAALADSELLPQLLQIGRHRLVLHLRVEVLQHRRARRFVADLQHSIDRPFERETRRSRAAPRSSRRAARSGWRSSCESRRRPADRTARRPSTCGPRCACDRGPRRPDRGRPFGIERISSAQTRSASQVAGVHARDALDVRRQTFGQPEVIVADFGQREMHHLVHEHPVVAQLVRSDVATDLQPDEWHARAVRRAVPDATAAARRSRGSAAAFAGN